jgi:Protein kinase domain
MVSWKLHHFSKLDHDQGILLTVESAPGTLRPINIAPSGVFDRWKILNATSGEHWSYLQRIVAECEAQYPLGARFGRRLFVYGGNNIEVREDFHPGQLPYLPRLNTLLENGRIDPGIAVAPISALRNASEVPPSLTYQTSLVVLYNQLHVAKGPTDEVSVNEVFLEVGVLSSLPKHRSIIGPPVALVAVSSDDERLVGYLLKYYPNGNVRDFAINNQSQLSTIILCKWLSQIAGALIHLLYKCTFTYVDIKPDNFLVDNDQNLVLADFSDDGCTGWIAAPELFHGHEISISTDGKDDFFYICTQPPNTTSVPRLFSIPEHWPREARDKAMVFSVGRSLWMIWEAIPAEKFIMSGFHLSADFDPTCTVFTETTSSVPREMKDFVLRCVRPDSKERPTLAEVEAFFTHRMTIAGESDGHV